MVAFSENNNVIGTYVPEIYVATPDNKIKVATVLDISKKIETNQKKGPGNIDESRSIADSIESVETTDSMDKYNVNANAKNKRERWFHTTLQVSVPFFIAGMGTIGAGLVLGIIEEYEVFMNIRALYVLVPALLGLKGNLDMCLASRLSTQANLGNMNHRREVFKMVLGNISIVQVQAIVAACVVSLYAVAMSAILSEHIVFKSAILVITCSILTATSTCFVLDFVLIAVIFCTHKIKMNPDNLATPLAASIGDVVSLSILSICATSLYVILDTYTWVFYIIIASYLFILLPMWIIIVLKNKYTKSVLKNGWIPVLSALFISGLGGLVLDNAVGTYEGYSIFQPVINGVGGNLVSVQASRISTMLHQSSLPGILPPHTKLWVAPWSALFKGVISAKTARILIAMAVPGQLMFLFIADAIYNGGVSTVTPLFAVTYLIVCLLQVMILLYTAHLLIHKMWKMKIDPDNSAIPYLTALGDLFGSTLLLMAFVFLTSIGQEYQPIK
ncbi:solute carrier family 41 member 1 [Agrilus planipennis]|uniref:Solute carrier family 41 member 1 n=1 Tax=Agrilus planipennis TaxID=224129 RepID=A0A7F5QZD3_AGRPL|nr:solute carrier family 41 member 1 [Agrilus planipennis]XP_025830671.1 solute carrier family 41 member 1 [Agrilus planipennis]